jgi:hypothetical protein
LIGWRPADADAPKASAATAAAKKTVRRKPSE